MRSSQLGCRSFLSNQHPTPYRYLTPRRISHCHDPGELVPPEGFIRPIVDTLLCAAGVLTTSGWTEGWEDAPGLPLTQRQ